MAEEKRGVMSTLKHAFGMEKGAEFDVVRLARWIGLFIIVSAVIMALWSLYAPFFGGTKGFPLGLRFSAFWTTLITPGWTGVAIILLAEAVERLRGAAPAAEQASSPSGAGRRRQSAKQEESSQE